MAYGGCELPERLARICYFWRKKRWIESVVPLSSTLFVIKFVASTDSGDRSGRSRSWRSLKLVRFLRALSYDLTMGTAEHADVFQFCARYF
jgi:hypothetical protein